MTPHDFEQLVLALWNTTRVPLTRANLLAYTKAPRARMDGWLDAMVRDSLLEVESDADGDLHWTVRGARRPAHGPQTLGEMAHLARLSAEVDQLAERRPPAPGPGRAAEGRKSVVLSGALSLFFGPMGWLYAGSMKEALPGTLFYLLLSALVPKFILVYLLGPLNAVAAVAGVLYAWSYNRTGRRETLLLNDGDGSGPRLPPRR